MVFGGGIPGPLFFVLPFPVPRRTMLAFMPVRALTWLTRRSQMRHATTASRISERAWGQSPSSFAAALTPWPIRALKK